MASSRPGNGDGFAKALKNKMNKMALRKGMKNYHRNKKEDEEAKKLFEGGSQKYYDKKNIPKVSEEFGTKTVFEVIKGNVKPAVVLEKEFKLQWKEGYKPENEEGSESAFEGVTPEALSKNKDFLISSRLMMEIRQHNMMEDVLGYEGNNTMRRFFEDGMEKPTQQILDLLHKAIEHVYNRIVFYNDDYNMIVDAEMRTFLVDKDRAKLILLDVMLMVPDFIPLNWGGKAVGMMLCDDPEAINHVVANMTTKKGGGGQVLAPYGTAVVVEAVPFEAKGEKPEEAKKEEEKKKPKEEEKKEEEVKKEAEKEKEEEPKVEEKKEEKKEEEGEKKKKKRKTGDRTREEKEDKTKDDEKTRDEERKEKKKEKAKEVKSKPEKEKVNKTTTSDPKKQEVREKRSDDAKSPDRTKTAEKKKDKENAKSPDKTITPTRKERAKAAEKGEKSGGQTKSPATVGGGVDKGRGLQGNRKPVSKRRAKA